MVWFILPRRLYRTKVIFIYSTNTHTLTSSCVSLSSTRCLRWKARFLERLSRSSGGISPLSNHCRSTTFSWLWVTYKHKHYIINTLNLSLFRGGSLDSKRGVRGRLFGLANSGGDLPLGCEMQWQLWCQNPESGYARCTLPSSHTKNKRAKKDKDNFWRCLRVQRVGVNGGLEDWHCRRGVKVFWYTGSKGCI